jgi:hypothetical protein
VKESKIIMYKKFFIFLIFAFDFVFAQFQETMPTDYWVYKIIEELKLRGHFRELPQGYKPYSRIEVARQILDARPLNAFDVKLFKILEDEFQDEINFLNSNSKNDFSFKAGVMLSEYAVRDNFSSRTFRFRGRSKFAFYFGDKFTLYNNSLADQNLLDDTTYTGNRFRGFFAGYTEQGCLSLNFEPFSIKLGRDYIKWGYGRGGNLLISDYAIPYDVLQIDLFSKKLKYSFFISQLENRDYSPDSGRTTLNANRYLTGGRFEFNFSDRFFIGFAQTILYGGANKGIDITLSNPFAFYYEFQANEGKEMNGMVYADLSFYPVKNLNFYGELLIDDWQVSRQTKGDLEPNEYGFIVGLRYADIFKFLNVVGSQVQIEYTQVRNRTYNVADNRGYQKYLRFKRPIAHPLGNDFQCLDVWVSQWIFTGGGYRNSLNLTLNYKFIEHGEGGIEKPWDEPWMAPDVTVEKGYKEKFPYGVVETTHKFGLNLFYFYSKNFNINFEIYFSTYKNYRNQIGNRKSEVSFKIWLFFNFDKWYH